MTERNIHTCECGRKWLLKKIKTIMRDSDSVSCSCGRQIIEWNGGLMYRVSEVKSDGSDVISSIWPSRR
jgi:hypothetical protein